MKWNPHLKSKKACKMFIDAISSSYESNWQATEKDDIIEDCNFSKVIVTKNSTGFQN